MAPSFVLFCTVCWLQGYTSVTHTWYCSWSNLHISQYGVCTGLHNTLHFYLQMFSFFCTIGIISRADADKLLCDEPLGSFLIRVSVKIWGYTVSVKCESNVYVKSLHSSHLQVKFDDLFRINILIINSWYCVTQVCYGWWGFYELHHLWQET